MYLLRGSLVRLVHPSVVPLDHAGTQEPSGRHIPGSSGVVADKEVNEPEDGNKTDHVSHTREGKQRHNNDKSLATRAASTAVKLVSVAEW